MYKNIKEPKLFGYVKYFLKKCFEDFDFFLDFFLIFSRFFSKNMVIGSTDTDIAIIGYRPIWPIRLLSADTDTDTDIGPFTSGHPEV